MVLFNWELRTKLSHKTAPFGYLERERESWVMAMWWAAVCLSLQSWRGTRDGFRLCYMDYVGLHTTRILTVGADSNQACWFLGVWMICRCVCMPLSSQIPASSVLMSLMICECVWGRVWITAVCVFSHWRLLLLLQGLWWLELWHFHLR